MNKWDVKGVYTSEKFKNNCKIWEPFPQFFVVFLAEQSIQCAWNTEYRNMKKGIGIISM